MVDIINLDASDTGEISVFLKEQHRSPGIRATFCFGHEDLAQSAKSTHQPNIYNGEPCSFTRDQIPELTDTFSA